MYLIASLVLVALLFWLLSARANETFYLSVRDGDVLLVRGGLPPTLQQALCDVVRAAHVRRARLRGLRQGGRAVLAVSGADAGTAQRLRNVFDSHGGPRVGLHQPPPGRRNLGQRLGWAWLAWRLRDQ